MRRLSLLMIVMILSVACYAQISGPTALCVGAGATCTDLTSGGTWSSSNTAIASIDVAGNLTGISAGPATITYTLPSSAYDTFDVTVNPSPIPMTGPTTIVCATDSIPFEDDPLGGVWSSSNTAVAVLNPVSDGLVGGVTAGTATISYTIGGCSSTMDITVNASPAPISGPVNMCSGATATFSDGVPGGLWMSEDTTVVAIGSSSGAATATAVMYSSVGLTYTLPDGCSSYQGVYVFPFPPPITGATSICAGGATTLSDAIGGGTWWSSDAAIATVDSLTGVVTSLTSGTATIYYSYFYYSGCPASDILTISAPPAAYTVTGGGGYCAGGSGVDVGLDGSQIGITYQLYYGGGVSGAPMAGTGLPLNFGLQTAAGVYTVVAYSAATGCSGNMAGSVTITVGTAPVTYTVSGGGAYCAGGPGADISLGGSDAGVNYQLYLGGSPVGGPVAGAGGPLDLGFVTAPGSYTIVATSAASGCTATMSGVAVVSISTPPAAFAVTGGGSYCAGGAGVDIGLSGSTAGVYYYLTLGTTVLAEPGSGSAIDFGLQTTAGTYTVVAMDTVTYCTSNMTGAATITITPLPVAYTIAGAGGSYCAGGSGADITLSASDAGVTYSLYSGATLVSSSSGTGAALDFGDHLAGTYTITATGGSCSTPMTGSFLITVNPLPTITAYTSSVACDGSYTLNAGGGVSYTWAGAGLSCTTCPSADVNPTASATYTVTGTDASGCVNTATTSVDGNRISGVISPAVSGIIRVWLIQFNPADSSLTALDSTTTCTSGGTQYYEFPDPASGNYMVKAYELGGTPGTSGYVPTYSSSAAHWDLAATVSHASATDNMNVTMIYGAVPAGPGFIGGYIASGAGKGTSATAPVEGMLVYLTDLSGNVLTYTYTDAYGYYGFNLIANGSYIIYPEFYQYTTTASAMVTLSSAAETINNVNFKQNTSNRTITPYNYSAAGVKSPASTQGIMVYPNPASGNLNIQWQNQPSGVAAIVITDVAGREVYRSAMNINAASGQTQVGLDGVKDGVYIITIKGEGINYNGKVVVQN